MEKINILITEDHKLVRETWTFMLNEIPAFNVVGEAGTGEEAVELARQLRPHVILMDINLPGINGIEATALIRKFSPGSKILCVSLHSQPAYVRKIMKAGASGYVTKNSTQEEMAEAIHAVHQNKKYFCEEVQNILAEQELCKSTEKNGLDSLSCRELDVIQYVIKGSSSKEIANSINIAVKTVEVHRYNILKKLKLKNVAALVNFINKNEVVTDSR